MNENDFYVVKGYRIDNPLITEKDSMINKCFRECKKNYFHNFEYECIYDNKLTSITNNETINLLISGKSMNL